MKLICPICGQELARVEKEYRCENRHSFDIARQGHVNLKESYAHVKNGEMFVEGMHISPYEQGNIFNTDPMRPKKLLMHKAEIRKLGQLVQRKGYTLIPLQLYLKDGRVKLELGVCVGKHLHDKRASAAERDAKLEAARAVREQRAD